MGHDLVPSAVHARSNAAPAQLALTDCERVISYEELDIRARRLARRLRELGAGRDVLVGVALDRSAEFVVAALGALYAGAAYVPLDCQYPAERIAFMLQDAAPAVVVSDARLAARLPRGAWPTLMIDVADGGDALAAEAVGADSTGSSLAFVIYPSRLTGRPSEAPLRVLLTGADTLHRHPPAGLPFTLVNNYGPTEAAVVTTSGAIASADAGESRPTIGKPIDNVDVHIVDEHLRPVATGMVGELCVGGAGVARGYRNRPELTAARFVPDPFSARPGARLYRTGDRARRLPDGDIAFLGRVDGQLKVRGFRIEPDEIVAALDADPAVVASAVAVHDDGAGDRRLVAYVVPAPDMLPLPSMLRERLKTTLPDYMIPAVFVRLDTLPLTANGKVDRDALPAPDTADVLRVEPVTAPRTPVEQRLALIVASLLDTSAVGVNDNFFLLGGHS